MTLMIDGKDLIIIVLTIFWLASSIQAMHYHQEWIDHQVDYCFNLTIEPYDSLQGVNP